MIVEEFIVVGKLQTWVIFEPTLLDKMPSRRLGDRIGESGRIFSSREGQVWHIHSKYGTTHVILIIREKFPPRWAWASDEAAAPSFFDFYGCKT